LTACERFLLALHLLRDTLLVLLTLGETLSDDTSSLGSCFLVQLALTLLNCSLLSSLSLCLFGTQTSLLCSFGSTRQYHVSKHTAVTEVL
jgi:hypothetical protein